MGYDCVSPVELNPSGPFNQTIMRTNHTKQLLQQGKVALGCGITQVRSAEMSRMFAAAGLDWAFIDTEHGCYTIETIQDLVRASLMTTITPIVRVADLQYSLIARALDMGAEGVIFPRIESPEKLAEAVSWTKFPPQGVRGYGLTIAHTGYQAGTYDQVMQHYNEQTLVVLQVETQLALDRCDELASVEGVDVIMVGPGDLSISLGVPGEFEHPKLVAAVEKVIECCERHKVWPSIQVRTPELAKFWMGKGVKLVGCSNEATLLWSAVSQMTEDLQAARGGQEG